MLVAIEADDRPVYQREVDQGRSSGEFSSRHKHVVLRIAAKMETVRRLGKGFPVVILQVRKKAVSTEY